MKIAHVVTYISQDGAFGGPVSVAFAQAAALAAQGHEVTVYAASDLAHGFECRRDGFSVRTVPARRIARGLGFAGMFAPGLWATLREVAPQLDVAHIHLGRDLVTLPLAMKLQRAGVPLVVQPHGMIDRSTHVLAAPVDALGTRRILTAAGQVLVLTEEERHEILRIAPSARTSLIVNGVPLNGAPPYEGRAEDVLFLARLHRRKRPMTFVEMAELVAEARQTTRFTIAGPDEGEGAAVRDAISRSRYRDRIRLVGAVKPQEVSDLLARSAVYVLPSVGEVFPMTVLESFGAGTPVVTTDSLGIASDCVRYGAAIVTDGTAQGLAQAVDRVLSDRAVVEGLRSGAQAYMRQELDIDAVARRLLAAYRELSQGAKDVRARRSKNHMRRALRSGPGSSTEDRALEVGE